MRITGILTVWAAHKTFSGINPVTTNDTTTMYAVRKIDAFVYPKLYRITKNAIVTVWIPTKMESPHALKCLKITYLLCNLDLFTFLVARKSYE